MTIHGQSITEQSLWRINMKKFLVPSFFIIYAENEIDAIGAAGEMQSEANATISKNFLMLDEELPTREVPIDKEATEEPHTYKEQEYNFRCPCGEENCNIPYCDS